MRNRADPGLDCRLLLARRQFTPQPVIATDPKPSSSSRAPRSPASFEDATGNNRLGLTSCRRATADTLAPGAKISGTNRSLHVDRPAPPPTRWSVLRSSPGLTGDDKLRTVMSSIMRRRRWLGRLEDLLFGGALRTSSQTEAAVTASPQTPCQQLRSIQNFNLTHPALVIIMRRAPRDSRATLLLRQGMPVMCTAIDFSSALQKNCWRRREEGTYLAVFLVANGLARACRGRYKRP